MNNGLAFIPKREWDLRTRIAQDRLPRIRSRARACRVCGCTETDCRQCIDPATGFGCHWVEWNLCSRCAPPSWRVFRATYLNCEEIELGEELDQVKAIDPASSVECPRALSNACRRDLSRRQQVTLLPEAASNREDGDRKL